MGLVCLAAACLLTVLLVFVSYVQLLYLESQRLLRRETAALEHFREHVAMLIAIETEHGALAFSLLKHVWLILLGALFFCALDRLGVPRWQIGLESFGLALLAMMLSTYFIPAMLYRRTSGAWLAPLVPAAKFLAIVIRPLTALVDMFNSLLSLGEPDHHEAEATDSVDSIEALITAGAEEGIFAEHDRQLIHSVVAFGDKTVREVMTARPNIIAISAERSLEEMRQLVIHEQYSRIPVYQGTIDQIIGFVHVRDMFELDPADRQVKKLIDLMRPIRQVPETKPVSALLREMQRDGAHMAVVVDEYGNTAGLATMEDLVEEILGEIHDEHEPDRDVRSESEDSFVAPGSLDLDRLNELFKFRPEEDTESTTVGGLAAEWLGHVPAVGESVERDGIKIEVLAGDERRVEQVRVSRLAMPASV